MVILKYFYLNVFVLKEAFPSFYFYFYSLIVLSHVFAEFLFLPFVFVSVDVLVNILIML